MYTKEAIEWSNVEFDNNDVVLSLYNQVGGAVCSNYGYSAIIFVA